MQGSPSDSSVHGLEVFEKTMQFNTTKEVWDTLEKAYFDDDKLKKVKIQSLRSQYEFLQMGEQGQVNDATTEGEVHVRRSQKNMQQSHMLND